MYGGTRRKDGREKREIGVSVQVWGFGKLCILYVCMGGMESLAVFYVAAISVGTFFDRILGFFLGARGWGLRLTYLATYLDT